MKLKFFLCCHLALTAYWFGWLTCYGCVKAPACVPAACCAVTAAEPDNAVVLTREQLRTKIVAGLDAALSHTFLFSADDRKVLAAMKAFWLSAQTTNWTPY